MFVQVVQGRVRDADKLMAQWERWEREVKPGAIGYLGTTAGIADDATFIAVARFESREKAMQNSDRREQDAWWSQTAGCFEGEVEFHDCDRVDLFAGGGSDDAGFVQVMQGRVSDADLDRVRAISAEMEAKLPALRPDLIGGFVAEHGDGGYSSVNYFTTEAEARKGESQDYPDDVKALFEEWGRLVQGMRYIDLKEPWLSSA